MDYRDGILDATLVPLGLLIILAYQVWLVWRVRCAPLLTAIGVNHLARRHWVESVMKDNDKKNILAVQSLRNTIMGSTLMASTAILMCSATAVFMSSAYFGSKEPLYGGVSLKLLNFKFLSLMACFLFSFLAYMQSVRYVNHVNFLVNIPLQDAMAIRISPQYVSDVLAKGCNFYTAGTRGFYVAFPLLLWLFSPIAVFCGCIMLVPVMYYLDASGLDSDDDFIRKNSLKISLPRHFTEDVGGVPRPFRACELRKSSDGNVLLTTCSDHWTSSDIKTRATQELGR